MAHSYFGLSFGTTSELTTNRCGRQACAQKIAVDPIKMAALQQRGNPDISHRAANPSVEDFAKDATDNATDDANDLRPDDQQLIDEKSFASFCLFTDLTRLRHINLNVALDEFTQGIHELNCDDQWPMALWIVCFATAICLDTNSILGVNQRGALDELQTTARHLHATLPCSYGCHKIRSLGMGGMILPLRYGRHSVSSNNIHSFVVPSYFDFNSRAQIQLVGDRDSLMEYHAPEKHFCWTRTHRLRRVSQEWFGGSTLKLRRFKKARRERRIGRKDSAIPL
ncbi:hypothetical protein CROQUDRAFT_92468 [Cronartium quercuum f. sp. fusiforme G11]|uniref:Uncharacterized protein n=1 Tax=Cronartium quercuum f. sp. fusiforme G11 TaxID=708437 RepID=A0A9P6NGQ6_9BASI|nr:hypothetical protein CROQUDRAFT_92468 [Cronartium quercuum f. sp. fusiforme G11]